MSKQQKQRKSSDSVLTRQQQARLFPIARDLSQGLLTDEQVRQEIRDGVWDEQYDLLVMNCEDA